MAIAQHKASLVENSWPNLLFLEFQSGFSEASLFTLVSMKFVSHILTNHIHIHMSIYICFLCQTCFFTIFRCLFCRRVWAKVVVSISHHVTFSTFVVLGFCLMSLWTSQLLPSSLLSQLVLMMSRKDVKSKPPLVPRTWFALSLGIKLLRACTCGRPRPLMLCLSPAQWACLDCRY